MNWLVVTIRVPAFCADFLPSVIAEITKTGTEVADNEDKTSITITAAVYQSAQTEEQLRQIYNYLEHLSAVNADFYYQTEQQEITEETWQNFWKSLFRPEKVGGNLVIVPIWHEYLPEQEEKVILLDPGTAFGTGTHTSTLLCIDFLNRILRPGDQLIDVGTGSGILAMAGAALGAGFVEALDFHQDAVTAASENVIRNQMQNQIVVRQSDLLQGASVQADVVVANISAAIIKRLLLQVPEHLLPGGHFICSGLSYDQRQEMTEAIREAGLDIIEIAESGTWISFLAKRR